MLISTESQLRKYLPNIQVTVTGEVSVYDKMSPFLDSAENGLLALFGIDEVPDFALSVAKKIVCCRAMADAAPSLNCVLTPNGFAVVYNQTMMPTAKLGAQNPTVRMIESLNKRAFVLETQMADILRNSDEWMKSEASDQFVSVFDTYDLARNFNCLDWKDFSDVKAKCDRAEQYLSNNFLGQELLFALHVRENNLDSSDVFDSLLKLVRRFVRVFIDKHFLDTALAFRISQLLKDNVENFPSWAESSVGQAILNPPDFSNEYNSSGYFF